MLSHFDVVLRSRELETPKGVDSATHVTSSAAQEIKGEGQEDQLTHGVYN